MEKIFDLIAQLSRPSIEKNFLQACYAIDILLRNKNALMVFMAFQERLRREKEQNSAELPANEAFAEPAKTVQDPLIERLSQEIEEALFPKNEMMSPSQNVTEVVHDKKRTKQVRKSIIDSAYLAALDKKIEKEDLKNILGNPTCLLQIAKEIERRERIAKLLETVTNMARAIGKLVVNTIRSIGQVATNAIYIAYTGVTGAFYTTGTAVPGPVDTVISWGSHLKLVRLMMAAVLVLFTLYIFIKPVEARIPAKTLVANFRKSIEAKKERRLQEIPPQQLSLADFKEVESLIQTLRDASKKRDTVSLYLKSKLPDNLQNQINVYDGETLSNDFLVSFVSEFNSLLTTSLYQEEIFAPVKLSEETQKLFIVTTLDERKENLTKFNRSLLEAAYPNEIEKSITRRAFDLKTAQLDAAVPWMIRTCEHKLEELQTPIDFSCEQATLLYCFKVLSTKGYNGCTKILPINGLILPPSHKIEKDLERKAYFYTQAAVEKARDLFRIPDEINLSSKLRQTFVESFTQNPQNALASLQLPKPIDHLLVIQATLETSVKGTISFSLLNMENTKREHKTLSFADSRPLIDFSTAFSETETGNFDITVSEGESKDEFVIIFKPSQTAKAFLTFVHPDGLPIEEKEFGGNELAEICFEACLEYDEKQEPRPKIQFATGGDKLMQTALRPEGLGATWRRIAIPVNIAKATHWKNGLTVTAHDISTENSLKVYIRNAYIRVLESKNQ